MRSNCPECGSSLTIKEAVENRCSYCRRPMSKAEAAPHFFKSRRVNLSYVRKNFDLMVSDELRKRNLSPAA